MKTHHTKNKGDIGVLKAQADLTEKGFLTLTPNSEHAPFDLCIYKDGEFRRVQVKYRTANKGVLQVHFRSSWSDQNGIHTSNVDKSEIDVYCVYCPDTDECYYFDPKSFNKSVSLRVETSKNSQTKLINWASDYTRVP